VFQSLSSTKPPSGRVLVVDDEPVMRLLFERSLQSAGFDVVVAEGGPQGLEKLREDPEIRVVLLDLNMPDMDGWGFRAHQRADPRLKDVPTVIVTGEPLARVVQSELHATEYLLKPVGRDHLISVVSEYCEPNQW
jgi:chemosensory pili system protein ChpA (sensor histidine kinase/response regulator)